MTESRPTVSFVFSKKLETKKLTTSAIAVDPQDEAEDTDFVTSINDTGIKSTVTKESKPKEFVIPLQQKKTPVEILLEKKAKEKKEKEQDERVDNLKEDEKGDIEQQAVKELLGEWKKRDESDELPDNSVVPMLLRDRDSTTAAPDADDPDYDAIPTEHFGLAMLRGMGWKEGRGIGLRHEKSVNQVEHQLRPKGLGLGADRSKTEQKNHVNRPEVNASTPEVELEMKRGTRCCVTSGKHSDKYGTIEGTDENTGRVYVRLTVSSESINLSQSAVRLCSNDEYNKYSKYINRSKAEKYKEVNRTEDDGEKDSRKSKSRRKEERAREESGRKGRGREDERRRDERSERKTDEPKQKRSKRDEQSESSRPWLYPSIRVRYIRAGRYYKQKMSVLDVVEPGVCSCQADDGKVLEEVKQKYLETVIPREEHSNVLIVRGKHKGQVALLINSDRSRCEAVVQLVQDPDTALTLSFDDFSQYLTRL